MKPLILAAAFGLIMLSGFNPLKAQSSFSRDECAVSVDIWLLGESCVMAGLQARYGEYVSAWSVDDEDLGESLAFILLRKRLLPITIASRPTDFGWIEGQPYIDFSLVDKIDTSNLEQNSIEGDIGDFKTFAAIRVDQFLSDADLSALYQDGFDIYHPRAQIIYQYFRMGYTLRTPWPWLKFTYGLALGYHYFNFDFYYQKPGLRTRLSFFNADEEFYGLSQFVSLAAYEGESLHVMKLMLLAQDKFRFSSTDRNLTLGHVFLAAELLSWSFYF